MRVSLCKRLLEILAPLPVDLADIEPSFCRQSPSNQTLIDIFKGAWVSEFAPEYHIQAGHMKHFDMTVEIRVKRASEVLPNGLNGLSILELGPFEAYNTWQLEQLGAQSVVAIESSNVNFLKCLLVKELLGLKARFLYGDFIPYLEQLDGRFNMIWASGVLYHQTEPLKLLHLISQHTDMAFIHTHYYDQDVLRKNIHAAHPFKLRRNVKVVYNGYEATMHYRTYRRRKMAFFSGGMESYSYWLEKRDILEFLRVCGFTRIDMLFDDPHNPKGPGMWFIAHREVR